MLILGKVKIQEICDILKTDISEKKIFFSEISSPDFLLPFYNAKVLNFNDEASYFVIQYLQRVYSKGKNNFEIKKIIINVINENMERYDINEIDGSAYRQLIKLLELFDIETFNNVNTKKIIDHVNSIEFVISLFKNNEICKNKDLVTASIKSILNYIITGKYRKKSEIRYEIYYLRELLNNVQTKNNFEIALKQDFIFDLLIKKYNEIYLKTHSEKNPISDVFSKQTMNIEEIKNNLLNNYYLDDVSDLILYFLSINLDKNDCQVVENIKKLLSHNIFILRKLGLHIIDKNINKYSECLIIFFDSISKTNIVKVTYICLYEIVNILKKYTSLNNKEIDNRKLGVSKELDVIEELDNKIKEFLEKFPKKEEQLKYYVLHGLKEHTTFKDLFYELKNKYKFEKENLGIYIQTGLGGWVKDVSPITEVSLKKKSIKEQIEYLNSDIEYNNKLTKIEEGIVEEINERGLVNLFKKVLEEDINTYLENENILKLNKKMFIQAILNVLTQKIDEIANTNSLVKLFDNIFVNIIKNEEEYKDLLYDILDFNICFSEKRPKDFSKIFKYVEIIAKNDFHEDYYENESDLCLKALNTINGRNFRCYFNYLVTQKKLNKSDLSFIKYIMKKTNQDKYCTFYYYLGVQYRYFKYYFENLPLLKKIENLNKITKNYFLEGFLGYCNSLESFKELKNIILNSFKNSIIITNAVRIRFVRMLLYLKLVDNENEIFNDFCKYFNENDYEITLNSLIYNDSIIYPPKNVMDYWCDIVNFKNKAYVNSLLEIFNKYSTSNDIEKYKGELMKLVKTGLPDNLVVNTGIGKFLERLYEYLRIYKNCAIVFNILEEVIISMRDVKYIYKELDIIKDILKEFKKQEKMSDAEVIAKKIYDTASIKFYSTNLKEFLIENN